MLISQILFYVGFAFACIFFAFMAYVGFKLKFFEKKGVSEFTPAEIGYFSIRFFPGIGFIIAIILLATLLQKWGY